MKKIVLVGLVLNLSGCVSYYDPMLASEKSGIEVESTIIFDSAKRQSGTRVHLFYVSKVDGKDIDNTLKATSRFNYGKGMTVQPMVVQRMVPANTPLSIQICAESYNGAPILDLFRADAKQCESLSRSFDPNKTYYVTGRVDGKTAMVEIVDEEPVLTDDNQVDWDKRK